MRFSSTSLISTTLLILQVAAGRDSDDRKPAVTPIPLVPAKNVTSRNITATGSGCPSSSYSAAISKDALSFTLIFDKFLAFSGAGSTSQDFRKQCKILLDLEYPASSSFSVVGVTYRGYVSVNEGVVGMIQSNLTMNDGLKVEKGRGRKLQDNTVSSGASFKGPLSEDFLQTDNSPSNNLVWTDCKKRVPRSSYGYQDAHDASSETPVLSRSPVVIDAEIQLLGNATQLALGNQIAVDSLDGKLNHTFTLKWRDC